MAKGDLFSKLNIIDYNNQLENILENKAFSENAKNILLTILYKVETAYEDYKKVKVTVTTKNDLLEGIIEIIKNNCDEIEIVKPKLDEKTKLEDKKYIIEGRKIISYPNEKNIFFALNNLDDKKFIIDSKYDILKKPVETLLNAGFIMDREEIIRDFDGWTWNITSKDIENYIYNLIYQNIKIIFGNDFVENLYKNNQSLDFIEEFEKKLDEIQNMCNKETNIAKLIYKIAMLEYIKSDNKIVKDLIETRNNLKIELDKMNDKKKYLHDIFNAKKVIGKNIEKIDRILNNNQTLRKNFFDENESLKEGEKIFSLSEYSEKLQNEKRRLFAELSYYNELMNPIKFVNRKSEILKKYKLLIEFNFQAQFDEEINKYIIDMQNDFLRLFRREILNAKNKKGIVEYIFLFRYYKLLYINDTNQIKDVKEISDELNKTERLLINESYKLKAINLFCEDLEKNIEIISRVLNYNIIDLEDVNLEFKKHDKNIILTIYDDNTIVDSMTYDADENLKLKFNKKIKLFD